jgi:hypothetical protein
MKRGWSVWMVTAATLVAVGGCGVPGEAEPRAVSPPRGPFGGVVSPTPAVTASGSESEQLCMVRGGALVTATRPVDIEPNPQRLLVDLLAGPTPAERADGITSALLGGNVVEGMQVLGGQAIIDLSDAMEAGRTDEVLAYAQLVCTLTRHPDIDGARFTRNGNQIAVPRGDGSLTDGPLTAADYALLMGSPSPSPGRR